MAAAAELVAIDVDFVTVAGRWLRGRREFWEHHRDIHERHLRATTWTTLAWDARRLRGGFVLAHVEWVIAGEPAAPGAPQPRTGIFTWLLARSGGRWLIAAAHNTNLRADTRHRLAGRTRS